MSSRAAEAATERRAHWFWRFLAGFQALMLGPGAVAEAVWVLSTVSKQDASSAALGGAASVLLLLVGVPITIAICIGIGNWADRDERKEPDHAE